jgi:hypothetical protein
MFDICPNSFCIKSYDLWGFQPSVPEVRGKILVITYLKIDDSFNNYNNSLPQGAGIRGEPHHGGHIIEFYGVEKKFCSELVHKLQLF